MKQDALLSIPAGRVPGVPCGWDVSFPVPSACPQCGSRAEPKAVSFSYQSLNKVGKFGVVSLMCTLCRAGRVAYYHIDSAGGNCRFVGTYPPSQGRRYAAKRREFPEVDAELMTLSPEGVALYREALKAGSYGDWRRALNGLLNATEALVKDYVIVELEKSPKKLAKMKLTSIIEKYLPECAFLLKPKTARLLLRGRDGHNGDDLEKDARRLRRKFEQLLAALSSPSI